MYLKISFGPLTASQVVLVIKNLPISAGDPRDACLILDWEHPLERAWLLTPLFLNGEPHGQRNLVDYKSIGLQRVRHDWSNLVWVHYILKSILASGLWEPIPQLGISPVVVQLLSHVRHFVNPWTEALRLPYASPSPGACLNSCPSIPWCHLTISSSVVPFSSCFQSFPGSASSPLSQLFTSGGQSIGVSASVLPMTIQDWFPLGLTGLISLQSKGLSRVFSDTTVQKCQFFGAQPLWSNSHIYTWLLDGLSLVGLNKPKARYSKVLCIVSVIYLIFPHLCSISQSNLYQLSEIVF